MPDLGSYVRERSDTTVSDVAEELDRYRRRVRELEQTLAERDRQQAANVREISVLTRAIKPAQIAVWHWTADTRLTRFYPPREYLRDALDLHANETMIAEEQLLQFVHPDDRERLSDAWDRAQKDHQPYEIDFRRVLSDGVVHHCHEIGAPEFDRSGCYLGHSGTTQIITRQIEAEEALSISEQRYRELFEEAPIGIWEMDFSAVKRCLDDLVARGITDIRKYFEENPEKLNEAYDLGPVVDISQAACEMYGSPNKQALISLVRAEKESDDEVNGFLNSVIAFMAGKVSFEYETTDYKLERIRFSPGHILRQRSSFYIRWG